MHLAVFLDMLKHSLLVRPGQLTAPSIKFFCRTERGWFRSANGILAPALYGVVGNNTSNFKSALSTAFIPLAIT